MSIWNWEITSLLCNDVTVISDYSCLDYNDNDI